MFIRTHATWWTVLFTLGWWGLAHAQATPGETPAPPPDPAGEAGDVGTVDPAGSEAAAPAAPAAAKPANIRLRSLEQRVQALKEQAWRIKARVGMLKEAVLGGGIGARASIVHQNKMGSTFRLMHLVYALDGTQIFARTDDGSGKLYELERIDILSGPIAPGNHTLSVLIEYSGHGFGVFAYINDYKFKVRSSHTFTASEGKSTQITVVGYERGGVTTPLPERPAVDFKVGVVAERGVGQDK